MLEFKENVSPGYIPTFNFLEKKGKELEEENCNLRKEVKLLILIVKNYLYTQIKKKENEYTNLKVFLEQKNELLQKQVEDYKLRENNFKIFNENIFALLNDLSSDKRLV